jgi:hypothetical protein
MDVLARPLINGSGFVAHKKTGNAGSEGNNRVKP